MRQVQQFGCRGQSRSSSRRTELSNSIDQITAAVLNVEYLLAVGSRRGHLWEEAMSPQRTLVAVVIAACVADCAGQRAQIANYAQNKMIGLTKEQVLACMGTPTSKATEGATEVWSYPSGNCTVNVTMMEGKVKRMTMLVQPAARYPKTSNVSSPSRTARIEQVGP